MAHLHGWLPVLDRVGDINRLRETDDQIRLADPPARFGQSGADTRGDQAIGIGGLAGIALQRAAINPGDEQVFLELVDIALALEFAAMTLMGTPGWHVSGFQRVADQRRPELGGVVIQQRHRRVNPAHTRSVGLVAGNTVFLKNRQCILIESRRGLGLILRMDLVRRANGKG